MSNLSYEKREKGVVSAAQGPSEDPAGDGNFSDAKNFTRNQTVTIWLASSCSELLHLN